MTPVTSCRWHHVPLDLMTSVQCTANGQHCTSAKEHLQRLHSLCRAAAPRTVYHCINLQGGHSARGGQCKQDCCSCGIKAPHHYCCSTCAKQLWPLAGYRCPRRFLSRTAFCSKPRSSAYIKQTQDVEVTPWPTVQSPDEGQMMSAGTHGPLFGRVAGVPQWQLPPGSPALPHLWRLEERRSSCSLE